VIIEFLPNFANQNVFKVVFLKALSVQKV